MEGVYQLADAYKRKIATTRDRFVSSGYGREFRLYHLTGHCSVFGLPGAATSYKAGLETDRRLHSLA
jgi:hypothetical protein